MATLTKKDKKCYRCGSTSFDKVPNDVINILNKHNSYQITEATEYCLMCGYLQLPPSEIKVSAQFK